MPDEAIAAQRAYWDGLYTQPLPLRSGPSTLGWLETMLGDADVALGGTILEIGCGRGNDTHYFVGPDRTVVSLDFSLVGLRLAALAAPDAHLVNAALPGALPFRAKSFDLVVAVLSLHYFTHAETHQIIADIRRVLRPGGALLFQVNAAGDTNSGYGVGEEIEPGVFRQKGRHKRFFTQQDCRELFADGWQLATLQQRAEHKYASNKQAWAGVARVRSTDSGCSLGERIQRMTALRHSDRD